jgi:hypothetical protein
MLKQEGNYKAYLLQDALINLWEPIATQAMPEKIMKAPGSEDIVRHRLRAAAERILKI